MQNPLKQKLIEVGIRVRVPDTGPDPIRYYQPIS